MNFKEDNKDLGMDIPIYQSNPNLVNYLSVNNKINRIKQKIENNDYLIKSNLEWIEKENTKNQSFNPLVVELKDYIKRETYYNQFYHKRLLELETELKILQTDLMNENN